MSRKKDWDWGPPPFGEGGGKGAEIMFEKMMRDMLEDPTEPRPEHEGTFIPETELHDWWRRMQRKYPQIYKAEDKLFGDDGTQHAFGTKLMAFFDDDPNRPIRLQVRGSRWVDEGFGTLTPMYVVRHKGSNELSQIELGSGHEEGGWRVGWDDGEGNVVPSDGELFGKNEEEEEESGEEDLLWSQQVDGPIADAFLVHTTFTPVELASLNSGDNDVLTCLSKGTHACKSSLDFEIRAVVMEIVLAWTHDHAGAVILRNEIGTKFQAIEFNSPEKCSEGIPRIQISYAISPEIALAENFLRGEDTKVIQCSDLAAVAIEQHIISNCAGEQLNDIGSGLLLYEGHLVPFSSQRNDEVPVISSEGIADGNFGIELELSCAVGTPRATMIELLENVAKLPIQGSKSRHGKNLPAESFRKHDAVVQSASSKGGGNSKSRSTGRGTVATEWRLVNDGSIRASSDLPSSSKFELVSPVLCGGEGLNECRTMIKALTNISAVQVNRSMGFHVHVDVDNLGLEELVRVCQNFVEYEDVIDSFLPPSRRTGSGESNRYFKSNRSAVLGGESGTVEEGRAKLAACKTKEELYDVMNPDGRYYKLNLQNLKRGRQPTIEFRQHSGTSDYQKVAAWVRFCMALVHNSASATAEPFALSSQRSTKQAGSFDDLFDCLIQDSTLKDFYFKRREELR